MFRNKCNLPRVLSVFGVVFLHVFLVNCKRETEGEGFTDDSPTKRSDLPAAQLCWTEKDQAKNVLDPTSQVAHERELVNWVTNMVATKKSFTPDDIKRLRERLLEEATTDEAGVDSVLVGLLSSWEGGREYLASKLALALADFPEEYVRAFDQVSEGQERQSAMKSLEKVLLQEKNAIGLEEAYDAMAPGPERNSMAAAIIRNSLGNGTFKDGLDKIDYLNLPEDRRAGLWFLIGKLEHIGVEDLDERTLVELAGKAKAEGMNQLLEATIKRIDRSRESNNSDGSDNE